MYSLISLILDPVWLLISNLIFALSSFKKWTSLESFINFSPKSLSFSHCLLLSSITQSLLFISFKDWKRLSSLSSDLIFFSNWLFKIEYSSLIKFSFSISFIFACLISKIEILSKSSPIETSIIILCRKFNTVLSCCKYVL